MISRTGNEGFSLIEVLVASVILFAGLGAVLKAYSAAAQAMDVALDTLAAVDLLREEATKVELQAVGTASPAPGGSGQSEKWGVVYQWETQVQCRSVTRDCSLQSAVIRVGRARGGAPHALQCEWLLFPEPPKGRVVR